MYVSAPFWFIALKMNPRYRRPSIFVGFVIMIASLIGASFAKSVSQLIATQGVMYAIGASMHYYPLFIYLDEYVHLVALAVSSFPLLWIGCFEPMASALH
jgi:hypothetical protein